MLSAKRAGICTKGIFRGAAENIPQFVLSNQNSREIVDLIVHISSQVVEQVYKQDIEIIPKLDVLNQSFTQWESEYFAIFNFVNIHMTMIVSLISLDSLTTPKTSKDFSALSTKEQHFVITILATLVNTRNNKINFFQDILSLYLFVSKVSQCVINYLNHSRMNVSSHSLRKFVWAATHDALNHIKKSDNIEKYFHSNYWRSHKSG